MNGLKAWLKTAWNTFALVWVSFLACLIWVYAVSRVFGIYMGPDPDGSENTPLGALHLPVWKEVVTVATWTSGAWLSCIGVTTVFNRRWPGLPMASVLALSALLFLVLNHAAWAVVASMVAIFAVGAYVTLTFKPRSPDMDAAETEDDADEEDEDDDDAEEGVTSFPTPTKG